MAAKAIFISIQCHYLDAFYQTKETPYKPPHRRRAFSKVPIVTFEPANSEAIKNDHTVSDSIFKVTLIIEIIVDSR